MHREARVVVIRKQIETVSDPYVIVVSWTSYASIKNDRYFRIIHLYARQIGHVTVFRWGTLSLVKVCAQ